MSDKTMTGRHEVVSKAATGRHAAVVTPVRKKRILSRKVSIYLGLFVAAVFMLIVSAVLIMNSAEKENYELRMANAKESFQHKAYEDALHQLRAAAEIDPSTECLMLIADCYDRLANYDKALEVLRTMNMSDGDVSRKIAAIEQKKAFLSNVEKFTIAGREYPVNSNYLALDSMGIKNENLYEMQSFYALENLSLADNEVSDISALVSFGGLTTLNLSGNSISDISALTNLKSLRTLYLDYNPISDLSPLQHLTGLANLSIKGIEISENELAALSAALPGCAIHSETAVKDVLDISMGGITVKSDVKSLNLSGQNLTDISAIVACKDIERLDLSNNNISDLSPLMNLQHLQWLNISNNQISDLRPLMGLPSLEYLDASANYISNTAAAGAISGLKQLNLSYNNISDFSGLRNLANLSFLSVKGTGLNDDALGYFIYLRNLIQLEIDDNYDVSFDAVNDMLRYIENCVLSHSALVYFEYVEGHKLRRDAVEVDLSSQGISDIGGLGNMANMEKLNLSQNSISNIYILQHTNSRFTLKELYLGSNNIVDITPIASCFNLEILDLSGNPINSAQPLLAMQNLQQLYIQGHQLTDQQLEELFVALPNCNIIYQ